MLVADTPVFSTNPPERIWRQAISEFAAAHGLPVDEVLNGGAFICNGLGFRLQYNVELDADGLVVVMDLGPIPDESAHAIQLQMLMNNARRPSALMGYFGMPLRSRRGAYAVRLDLQKTRQPATAIKAMVEGLAQSTFTSLNSLKETFHAASGVNPDDFRIQAA